MLDNSELILPVANSKIPCSFSIPIKRRFSLSAAMPVVPMPINGSNTISSRIVSFEITCSASTGDCSHLCNALGGGSDSIKSVIESSVFNLLPFTN